MNSKINTQTSSDEMHLYYYWKIIKKRKLVLITFFLSVTIGTTIVSLLMPKLYKGEYIVKMETNEFLDILEKINSNDKERLREVLPNTYQLVTGMELTPLHDTFVYKLQVHVKDTGYVRRIASELFEYISNFPMYKRSVELKKEMLQKQSEELSVAISNTEDVLKKYNAIIKSESLVHIAFNPIEFYPGMLVLKNNKAEIEQSLKKYRGIEIIVQDITSRPVKPRILMNMGLAAFIGLIGGIFFVFIAEFANKISSKQEKESET